MMSEQWEDDDFLDDEDDEDMEDEAPPPPPPPAPSNHRPSGNRPKPGNTANAGNSKNPRRLRVKPMSPGMMGKWPDVTSCLLTLASGKQVMFVRPTP